MESKIAHLEMVQAVSGDAGRAPTRLAAHHSANTPAWARYARLVFALVASAMARATAASRAGLVAGRVDAAAAEASLQIRPRRRVMICSFPMVAPWAVDAGKRSSIISALTESIFDDRESFIRSTLKAIL